MSAKKEISIKTKEKNASITGQLMLQRRSISLRNLLHLKGPFIDNESLSKVGTQKNLKQLKIEHAVNITSLENLPEQPNLQEIDLEGTKLNTYAGLSKFKHCSVFNAKGTPLCNRPNYRIALLLAFGPRIREINGEKLTYDERMHAFQFPPICKELVEHDWDPTNDPPSDTEIPSLIEKYLPEDHPLRTNTPKGEEMKQLMTPKKQFLPPKGQKKGVEVEEPPVFYDKTKNDQELVNKLIEKFKEIGIFINKDENAQQNLLRVIKEFADITSNITSFFDFTNEEEDQEQVDN